MGKVDQDAEQHIARDVRPRLGRIAVVEGVPEPPSSDQRVFGQEKIGPLASSGRFAEGREKRCVTLWRGEAVLVKPLHGLVVRDLFDKLLAQGLVFFLRRSRQEGAPHQREAGEECCEKVMQFLLP